MRVKVPGHSDQEGREQRADDNERDRSEHGREYDHQQPEHDCRQQFDADRVVRLRKQTPGQGTLKDLSVNLDTRHRRIDRRGLDIVEPHRRGPDQHQLVRYLFVRNGSVEHVGCRNKDRRIVARKVNPELAVAIGRNLQTPDGDALDTGFFGSDDDRRSNSCHPQYFKTERRHDGALGPQQHRHPPDNAVALGLDRDQTASGRRCFQNADIAQQAGKFEQERRGILSAHRDPGHRQRAVEFRCHVGQRGFAQHHA